MRWAGPDSQERGESRGLIIMEAKSRELGNWSERKVAKKGIQNAAGVWGTKGYEVGDAIGIGRGGAL